MRETRRNKGRLIKRKEKKIKIIKKSETGKSEGELQGKGRRYGGYEEEERL